MPGVVDKSGSGRGRLGRELPVLGHVFSAAVLHDIFNGVSLVDWMVGGVKPNDGGAERARRTLMRRYFMVQVYQPCGGGDDEGRRLPDEIVACPSSVTSIILTSMKL